MQRLVLLLIVLCTSSFVPYRGRPSSVAGLRENYVVSLKSYEGMAYARYGDDSGISCSTLIRRAFIETTGIDGRSRAFIAAHPCDSDELANGCDGRLSLVLQANNLKSLDYDRIEPGDIAVIGNGVGIHAMAYAGNKTWIHADPIAEQVIETDETDENDDWLMYKVRVLRWNALK